jgi:hypothetical protein
MAVKASLWIYPNRNRTNYRKVTQKLVRATWVSYSRLIRARLLLSSRAPNQSFNCECVAPMLSTLMGNQRIPGRGVASLGARDGAPWVE